MGLDMYAFITHEEVPDTDFRAPESSQNLCTWRKHPNLHGWMESLYYEKGGTRPSFNCATLKITARDLDQLELAVNDNALPETCGFFFGESTPEDKLDDLAFIEKARKALAEGYNVFYDSWW